MNRSTIKVQRWKKSKGGKKQKFSHVRHDGGKTQKMQKDVRHGNGSSVETNEWKWMGSTALYCVTNIKGTNECTIWMENKVETGAEAAVASPYF